MGRKRTLIAILEVQTSTNFACLKKYFQAAFIPHTDIKQVHLQVAQSPKKKGASRVSTRKAHRRAK